MLVLDKSHMYSTQAETMETVAGEVAGSGTGGRPLCSLNTLLECCRHGEPSKDV